MSEKVTFLDKTFVKYISSEEIDDAIARVASDIMLEYRYDDPILLITLNGAIVFAVDLLKRLDFPCRITCVKLASYSGTESSGTINQLIGLSVKPEDMDRTNAGGWNQGTFNKQVDIKLEKK